MPPTRLPRLPNLLQRKLYKTGQTRGADDDVIYQNRVGRNSTVLIPYPCWDSCAVPPDGQAAYENGYIVLISPTQYFGQRDLSSDLDAQGLRLGTNTLVFYETRDQWDAHNPDAMNWEPAARRTSPLGGQYVARVPATTAQTGGKIVRGFNNTRTKGAGIRAYEYASSQTIQECRLQLEGLFWLCRDACAVLQAHEMTSEHADLRKAAILQQCEERGLLDKDRLTAARMVDADGNTICPLCLQQLSGEGFLARLEQAEGRQVPDLTVTQINLFHIAELRYGVLGHRAYNVAWGHHHCNVVTRDIGIAKTLKWMQAVVDLNLQMGHLPE